MSGGGGDSGFEPRDEGTPCGSLNFDTTLASPQPQVVATLTVGDELTVELQPAAAGGRPSITALDANGNAAGSIVDRVADLLRCLQSGYSYVARVISVTGGVVLVHVEAS